MHDGWMREEAIQGKRRPHEKMLQRKIRMEGRTRV